MLKWPEDYINKVICGDCLEVMKGIPDRSIDLVLTDPPYGISFKSARQTYQKKIENDGFDEWLMLLPKMLSEFKRIRRLTPVECERLQGFPDNWTKAGLFGNEVKIISDSQRYKMCGNAVTTNVITAIINRLNQK